MNHSWNYFSTAQLSFGPGSVSRLEQEAARHNWQRAFLVTDENLVSAGLVQAVAEPLAAAGCQLELFSGGQAEPSIEVASQAIDVGRQSAQDVVLGLGGGSNMDLAKIVAAVLTHGGDASSYFGSEQVPGPIMPLVCIPTTAGTGSEVSHCAVLTDTDNEIKVSSQSNYLRPMIALVDPQLTYSCPRQVAADSGIDALTHAIEAYTAVESSRLQVPEGQSCSYEGSFPITDCLAEKAIQLLGENLVAAVNDASNTAAKDAVALAATLAGLAFSNAGVALVHALEYPLGGVLHCSHGAGNGLLLPYVMRFNLPARVEVFARIAELLGVETDGLPAADAGLRGIEHVEQIRRQIGIPLQIRELGGRRDQLELFADKTFEIQRLFWLNPRQASREDVLEILQNAF
jgi:alcohol dehydrogenase class IV